MNLIDQLFTPDFVYRTFPAQSCRCRAPSVGVLRVVQMSQPGAKLACERLRLLELGSVADG